MMKNVDMERVVIPLDQIVPAQKALQEHVKVLYNDAKWLKKHVEVLYEDGKRLENHDFYSISVLFFILCMEEIAKFYVMAKCKSDNRDVTVGDMQPLYDHKTKIEMFLQNTDDSFRSTETLSATALDYAHIATTLNSIKKRAVYFEHKNSHAVTLESILGSKQVSNIAFLLHKALSHGISTMQAHFDSKSVSNNTQTFAQNGADFRRILVRVMTIAQALQTDNALDTDTAIPKEDFDIALESLEDHIAVLDKIAALLHNDQRSEASIFMSIISFEESVKHYLIAKCRREKRDVSYRMLIDLEDHKKKLKAFFKDVSDALGESNKQENSKNESEYAIIHPKAFLKLNGVKQLAVYFNYLDNKTFSLKDIFDDKTTAISHNLRMNIQGMISWMIICDGDSKAPYKRHNPNPAHYQRYQDFCKFRTDPKNDVHNQMIYYIMGLLNCLNCAVRDCNTSQCNAILSKICKYIRD